MAAAPLLHQRDFARTTLLPRHQHLVPKLAEAYFAHEGPMDPVHLAEFTQEVDRAISTASKTMRFGLLRMLDVILVLPLFIVRKPRLFTDLSLDDRALFLTRLERAKIVPLALIFVAWKTLMTMVYFEEDEQLRVLGYPGASRTRHLSVVRGVR